MSQKTSIKSVLLASVLASQTAACSILAPAPAATNNEEVEVYRAVADLVADYGFTADHRDAPGVSQLFTPNGRLVLPHIRLDVTGQDAIAATFGQAWEPIKDSGIQRHHIITGLRLTSQTADAADFRAVMNVTEHTVDGTRHLSLTGFYTGTAVRTPDGWRYAELQIHVDN